MTQSVKHFFMYLLLKQQTIYTQQTVDFFIMLSTRFGVFNTTVLKKNYFV